MMIPEAAKLIAIELLYGRARKTASEENFLRHVAAGHAHSWTAGQRAYFDGLARRLTSRGKERRL